MPSVRVPEDVYSKAAPKTLGGLEVRLSNIGALMIRIGRGGVLYYDGHKKPTKPYSNY